MVLLAKFVPKMLKNDNQSDKSHTYLDMLYSSNTTPFDIIRLGHY